MYEYVFFRFLDDYPTFTLFATFNDECSKQKEIRAFLIVCVGGDQNSLLCSGVSSHTVYVLRISPTS